MARWIGTLLVVWCMAVLGWSPAESKDRPVAKSLTRTGPAINRSALRNCASDDVLGNWSLVTFDSSYRFRNPQAPYLFPYQIFQYSSLRGAKSAHSRLPILDSPDLVFETVVLDRTYRVERGGRIVIRTKGRGEPIETWSCRVVTQDHAAPGGESILQTGDLVMTLLGSEGQALFVRQLRKIPV